VAGPRLRVKRCLARRVRWREIPPCPRGTLAGYRRKYDFINPLTPRGKTGTGTPATVPVVPLFPHFPEYSRNKTRKHGNGTGTGQGYQAGMGEGVHRRVAATGYHETRDHRPGNGPGGHCFRANP
jgi:hypothetical protein